MSPRIVPISVPVLLVLIAACGGSSSETPFPIEPDWRREAKSSGPSRELVFSGSDTDAGAEDIEEPGDPEAGEATPTWGGTDELEDLESAPPRPRPKQPPPEAEEDLELELQ